jgi:hypothetical protein
MIADLNPSIPVAADAAEFDAALQDVKHMTPSLFHDSKTFGDRCVVESHHRTNPRVLVRTLSGVSEDMHFILILELDPTAHSTR